MKRLQLVSIIIAVMIIASCSSSKKATTINTDLSSSDLSNINYLYPTVLTTLANRTLPEQSGNNDYLGNLGFEIHGKYSRLIKKNLLNEPNIISDFIIGYPVNWVTDYTSVEILVINNGKTTKAKGINEMLTSEQKNLLKMAEINSDILVNISYKSMNSITKNMDDSKVNMAFTVVPEIEAEYIGGYQKLKSYLKEKAILEISRTTPREFQHGEISFTIDEEGNSTNVILSKPSGDSITDNLLLEAIKKMPKWKPAENLDGAKVKQNFIFIMSASGC